MSAPDYPTQSTSSGELEDRVRRDAADLADTAKQDFGKAADELKQEAAALGDEARHQLEQATEKAKSMADQQKQLLVDQIDGVSGALDKVAGELEEQGEGTAHYVRMIADGAGKLTSTVRDNSIDDMLAIAEDFGRKQPVAFMGAAALLGFVASRFMVASAERRGSTTSQQSYQPRPAPSYQPTPQPSYGGSPSSNTSSTSTAPSYSQSVGGNDAGL